MQKVSEKQKEMQKVLQQSPLSPKVKIHMNECICERDCVCELIKSSSLSLLVVKLWDLVIEKYMFEHFRF